MKNIYLPCLLALCLALAISSKVNSLLVKKGRLTGPIAYIDYSHGERFSLAAFGEYGIDGLILNLMREDYLPVIYKDFLRETISSSSMFVLIAPTHTFRNDEVNFGLCKFYFYRTSQEDEIDLLVKKGANLITYEIKTTSSIGKKEFVPMIPVFHVRPMQLSERRPWKSSSLTIKMKRSNTCQDRYGVLYIK